DNTATVFGLATAPEWASLLDGVNQRQPTPFNLAYMPDGYGPSDHSSFYGAGIPVLHFFTNTHSEYHRPEDDWGTINGPDLDRLAALVADVAGEVAGVAGNDGPAVLTLVQASPPEPSESGGRGYGPYFGSIPDMGYQGYGVRLSGAREGSPAANAGLRSGDVIVAFGGTEVGDLYQYTYALREMAPGDVVEVVVERDGVRVTVQAVLGERR
ncbi:MAG TPA: PDZ domain-containing protein, partial [Longimicrobiales bacterium]|nr:PDZ domain-containing protein [Longimicrobiales bacterium]